MSKKNIFDHRGDAEFYVLSIARGFGAFLGPLTGSKCFRHLGSSPSSCYSSKTYNQKKNMLICFTKIGQKAFPH